MSSDTNKPLDNFLRTLIEVIGEQSATIKTQQPRLHRLIQESWSNLAIELPQIRPVEMDKTRFLADLPYRLEVVRSLQHAMNDGYFVIKAIVDALFNNYIQSGQVGQDFSEEDQIPVSFLISEILVGSLLQFVVMDKSPIPIGFIIIAKNKSMMKLKSLTISRITEDLARNSFNTSAEEVGQVLEEMCELGYIEKELDSKTGETAFKFVREFKLSPEGEKHFQKHVKPLLEWAVELWRSIYNIRSMDTPIPENYPHREFLQETVKRAATQGFASAYNVMENIGNYYQTTIEQNLSVP